MRSGVYRGNDNTLPVAGSSRWREVKGVGPKIMFICFYCSNNDLLHLEGGHFGLKTDTF